MRAALPHCRAIACCQALLSAIRKDFRQIKNPIVKHQGVRELATRYNRLGQDHFWLLVISSPGKGQRLQVFTELFAERSPFS